jgi:hypothetical protein
MSPIIWENCRRLDGSIDLEKAAQHTGCFFSNHALNYLVTVEKIKPILSRQVAALAIANALEMQSRG